MVTSMLMSSLVVWLYTKIGQQSVLKWGKISTFNEAFQFSAKIAHLFAMEGHFWRLFIADPCFYLPLPLPLSLSTTPLDLGAQVLLLSQSYLQGILITHLTEQQLTRICPGRSLERIGSKVVQQQLYLSLSCRSASFSSLFPRLPVAIKFAPLSRKLREWWRVK